MNMNNIKPNKKIHNNISEAIIQSLISIFKEGYYADKVIEYTLKSNKKWGSRDRKLIAESVYDIVRWWRLLWAVYAEEPEMSFRNLKNILYIYLYLFKKNEYEFTLPISANEINDRVKSIQSNRAIRESIPDWLDQLGEKELKEKWDQEITALNKEASVILRVNSLKTNIPHLKSTLEKEGVTTNVIDGFPEALELTERKNIFRTLAFKNGLFEVQDAASQQVGYFSEVAPGMKVIDACAGGGGKSLHLATFMKNKGKIISLDIHEKKLMELKKRAARGGVDIIEARTIDNQKVIKRLHHTADRLLLDVPCSGLGVLRRNPDAKWKLSPEFIEEVKETQRNILENYTTMLKPGGKLVYVTCSLLPSESEEQIKTFLEKNNANFKLEKEKRYSPAQDGFDGFYMAKLVRC